MLAESVPNSEVEHALAADRGFAASAALAARNYTSVDPREGSRGPAPRTSLHTPHVTTPGVADEAHGLSFPGSPRRRCRRWRLPQIEDCWFIVTVSGRNAGCSPLQPGFTTNTCFSWAKVTSDETRCGTMRLPLTDVRIVHVAGAGPVWVERRIAADPGSGWRSGGCALAPHRDGWARKRKNTRERQWRDRLAPREEGPLGGLGAMRGDEQLVVDRAGHELAHVDENVAGVAGELGLDQSRARQEAVLGCAFRQKRIGDRCENQSRSHVTATDIHIADQAPITQTALGEQGALDGLLHYSIVFSMKPSVLAFSISVRTFARSSPDGTSASISSFRVTSLPGRVVSCSTTASTT